MIDFWPVNIWLELISEGTETVAVTAVGTEEEPVTCKLVLIFDGFIMKTVWVTGFLTSPACKVASLLLLFLLLVVVNVLVFNMSANEDWVNTSIPLLPSLLLQPCFEYFILVYELTLSVFEAFEHDITGGISNLVLIRSCFSKLTDDFSKVELMKMGVEDMHAFRSFVGNITVSDLAFSCMLEWVKIMKAVWLVSVVNQ